jgi:glycosyltransferase involved in cell wall biosynthesis
VSIVIPNFNYGEYLRQALQSVSSQTYSNWEIIVVDNFSTDESEEICHSFSPAHRLKLIKHLNYGLPAISRNVGIRESTGQLIAFLDSDDLWAHNKLELAVRAYSSGHDISYHDMKAYGASSGGLARPKKVFRSRQLRKTVTKDLLLRGNSLLNSSVVVSKAVLDQVGPLEEKKEIVGAEDYNLWLRISLVTSKFCKIKGTLGSYRVHDLSMSRKHLNTQASRVEAVKNFVALTEKNASLDSGLLNLLLARENLALNNLDAAMLYLVQSLKLGSFEIRLRAGVRIIKLLVSRIFKSKKQSRRPSF